MQFDARAAKALQPCSYIVVDGCKGLRLVASASRKTWTYRYKHPDTGQMKQVRLGYWPEMPPVEAATRWSELRAVRDGGGDPQASRKKRATAVPPAPAVYTLVRAGAQRGLTGALWRTLREGFPTAQMMVCGVLGPKSNAHGPNEFLHVPYAKRLTASV
eukprot:gene19349-27406_t